MAIIRETTSLIPCEGCADPANHPHAFDCPGNQCGEFPLHEFASFPRVECVRCGKVSTNV